MEEFMGRSSEQDIGPRVLLKERVEALPGRRRGYIIEYHDDDIEEPTFIDEYGDEEEE